MVHSLVINYLRFIYGLRKTWNSKKISIEASSIFGWEKYVDSDGTSLGLKSFGKSAPYKLIYEELNMTSDSVVMIAKKMLDK